MTSALNNDGDARLDAAVALAASERDSDHPTVLGEFIRHYYAGVPREDLATRDPADLYGAATAHYMFSATRIPGTPKVRVYNPQTDLHGWQSNRTVIEITNDDMPFLVDSVRMLVSRRGLATHLIIHPILHARRDADGILLDTSTTDDATLESLLHFEIDRQTDQGVLDELVSETQAVLADVRSAVFDWQAMRLRLAEIIATIETEPPPVSREEIAEAIEFLRWINEHHFTFLGFREYVLTQGSHGEVLSAVEGSALGLFHGKPGGVSNSFAKLPREIRQLASEPSLLTITKANTRSTVHREGHLDYIGVKRFDASGTPIGEWRFLGLYTSGAYNQNPRTIPLLRHKLARAMQRSGFRDHSHDAKNLLNILESFPRDLLFQINDDALFECAVATVQLQDRQQVRLFVYPDRYERFVSCIVYVPRDRFDTQIRKSIERYLAEALNGTVADFNLNVSEAALARLFYVYRVGETGLPAYEVPALQRALEQRARNWNDELHAALIEHFGDNEGARLFYVYGSAFRADYRQSYTTNVAIDDIKTMESLGGAPRDIAMSLYQPRAANDNPLRLKLFHAERPIALFDSLPILENMGLQTEDEHPSRIDRANASQLWLHDFGMDHHEGPEFDIEPLRQKFCDAFERIWCGHVENDRLNGLVLRAGLNWRQIVVLRACEKYLRQARAIFSQDYIESTLLNNPAIARLLVELFEHRFDPDRVAIAIDIETLNVAIEVALDAVPTLDEDRILRRLRALIMAMLRTNFYQTDTHGDHLSRLSFKVDPKLIAELPEPRPMYEIFVYSPRVEGVHLRGGHIARGGLRWSDRREDFRTEILGLVKAQMVKNAVIVPVGSKGGFYPKQLPSLDREAIQAEGIACYEIFIRGLLDLTDNLVEGTVVPTPRTVRYDGDDTYLVVAADKGTASFSDIANFIAVDAGFWLGDAFASGGSNGYDHKAMAITARGAWEAVKRHFRELGLNIQTTDFTVVGIGDMAGDVFGNGMLLSEHTRLVAAFNHMHIFLDPGADTTRAYAERKRLFHLPSSSWDDYDRGLLSPGGGIWPRTAKSIPLSQETRVLLQIDEPALPPNELIQAILRAPVDLLWNGGIGTYVKSSDEDHDEVGDRANDALRIDADELRVRAVGEGGNLGVTQRARIEFAELGGHIFTDAIDNSGGVDCSDHEVNIKILLNEIVAGGGMNAAERNVLLASMTDEVAELVLRNNYLQTQALSIATAEADVLLEQYARFAQRMQADGELDRELEFLPNDEEIAARLNNEAGYTAPELAVLLAYAKIGLYPDLLASTVADDPYLQRDLLNYFPSALRKPFADQIPEHRLAREIICTVLTNEIVNRCGITFAQRIEEVTGFASDGVARAYLIARDVFSLPAQWKKIESLDNQVPSAAQVAALLQIQRLIERSAQWLLRNRPQPLDILANVDYFADGAKLLASSLGDLVPRSLKHRLAEIADGYEALGLPRALAQRIAAFDEVFSVFDIVEVAVAAELPVRHVASLYFELGARLELEWMRDQIAALPQDNRWQTLAAAALREDLDAQCRVISAIMLNAGGAGNEPRRNIEPWLQRNALPVARWKQVLVELQASAQIDFSMLSVAVRELRGLREQSPDNSTSRPV